MKIFEQLQVVEEGASKVGIQQLTCRTCDEYPPRESYVCVDCGTIPKTHPLPTIGCKCVALMWMCRECKEKKRDRS